MTNKTRITNLPQVIAMAFATMLCTGVQAAAAPVAATPPATTAQATPPAPVASSDPARLAPSMDVAIGKSTLLRLPEPIERVSVGNPAIADVTVISQRELYILGKDLGATNVIVWPKSGAATVVDIRVIAEPAILESELRAMLPGETDIRVRSSADSIVLQGTVADSVKAAQAVQLAEAWVRRLTRGLVLPVTGGDGKGGAGTSIQVGETRNLAQAAQVAGPQVVNMLRVRDPQQVMLEVKVAEVSKTLMDRLGVQLFQTARSGATTFNLLSQSSFLRQLLGFASVVRPNGEGISVDAQRDNGLVKLLAEPNIMAISGQEASFRAGGKIFIPVARDNGLNGTSVTLEEKEFGVGVKFKPTVLEGGRINLRVSPEVSELNQTGTPFTTVNGSTSVLPSFTLRRAETTVQLNDGQSFMIAGLIRNDVSQTINRFPGLGDVPILGALFRSSEFQADRSELMFVITPRLVKPLPPTYALPTDSFVPPSPAEFLLDGKMESGAKALPAPETPTASPAPAPASAPAGTAPARVDGFQVR